MSRLTQNTTPAERMRGCVWSENFRTSDEVASNGGSIVGSVEVDNGAKFNGLDNNYIYYSNPDTLNNSEISISIEFVPEFEADDNLSHYFLASISSGAYRVIKFSDNSLSFTFNTGGFTVVLSNYQSYWYVNKRNVLVVSATSGNNKVYLNGVELSVSGATSAWAPTAHSGIRVGARHTGIQVFDGTIVDLKTFKSLLTEQEAIDFYNQTTYRYMEDAILNLPMTACNHDHDNVMTLDRSGNGNHAVFGDGATESTFPTKLVKRGYNCDSDYFDVNLELPTPLAPTTVTFLLSPNEIKGGINARIFNKYIDVSNGMVFALEIGTNRLGGNFRSGGVNNYLNCDEVISPNQWAVLSLVFDGSNVYAYKDGRDITGGSVLGITPASGSSNLIIGMAAPPSANAIDACFGNFIIHNKPLTPIQAIDLQQRLLKQVNHV
jgi:hypothetical protein